MVLYFNRANTKSFSLVLWPLNSGYNACRNAGFHVASLLYDAPKNPKETKQVTPKQESKKLTVRSKLSSISFVSLDKLTKQAVKPTMMSEKFNFTRDTQIKGEIKPKTTDAVSTKFDTKSFGKNRQMNTKYITLAKTATKSETESKSNSSDMMDLNLSENNNEITMKLAKLIDRENPELTAKLLSEPMEKFQFKSKDSNKTTAKPFYTNIKSTSGDSNNQQISSSVNKPKVFNLKYSYVN